MGLFEKKVQTAVKPLYTLGLSQTYLIVGLGNPGKKYAATRHNLGFMCLDYYAASHEFPGWSAKKDFKCSLNMQTITDKRIILIKPTTFMNNSGQAVRAVQQFYEVPSNHLLVVHDELDIEFGQIRARLGGGSAGHNGLKSLIEHLGEDFARVRIGIGKPSGQKEAADYVLSLFNKAEKQQLDNLTREAGSIIDEFIFSEAFSAETRSFLV